MRLSELKQLLDLDKDLTYHIWEVVDYNIWSIRIFRPAYVAESMQTYIRCGLLLQLDDSVNLVVRQSVYNVMRDL